MQRSGTLSDTCAYHAADEHDELGERGALGAGLLVAAGEGVTLVVVLARGDAEVEPLEPLP